jgi:DNA-3-methyladenine glycosylase II
MPPVARKPSAAGGRVSGGRVFRPGKTDPVATFEKARRALKAADPRLAEVIRRTGRQRPDFTPRDPLAALVRALVSQQLSTKAAATIHGRVLQLMPSLTAENILRVEPAALRAAGLSNQKVAYLRDLAKHVSDGRLDLTSLHQKTDDEVIEAIMAVKGFGRWSAQMFLMFCLHRPDVLPTGDLGIVKGMQGVLGMKRRPAVRTMERAARAWQPYRTIACWYVWRSLE